MSTKKETKITKSENKTVKSEKTSGKKIKTNKDEIKSIDNKARKTTKKSQTKITDKTESKVNKKENKLQQVDIKETEKTKNKKQKTNETKKENELQQVDIKEIKKTIKQELKDKKTITDEVQKKLNGEVFKNIIIAIVVVVFLNFIILGFINIESQIFIVDLKVFAISILAIAIGIFEHAYKKDSGKIAIYGIETLVLAFCMLAFIYIDIMYNSKFVIITILLTYVIAIYYTAKSIIIYQKMKKQYFIDSMKKIIKK